jgi:hypothetical protein
MSSLGEAALRALADAIAANGMLAANYSWFNLDDGIVSSRDASGALVADARGFPSGVRALADHVNGLGLALGVYTDRGTTTCEGRPGAKGHEAQDAATWVAWGATYIKSDSCSSSQDYLDAVADYGAMRAGLDATGVDVFFSLCAWFSGYAAFATLSPPVADTWRLGTDVPDFNRFMQNIEAAAAAANFTGPGRGWPDVDMIGGHWSAVEERLHVCFIAVIGGPLLLSFDVTKPSSSTLGLAAYLNAALLAVHSDDAAPSVRERGRYYARLAGGAVTGRGTAGMNMPALPVDTDVPCDSPRAAFTWTPNATDGSAWGTLESVAAPGYCLGVWDEWTGACIDALAAQLVPCGANSDGCDERSQLWSPGAGGALSVAAYWGGGTPEPGPLLTQVGGVPSALYVQSAAPASPPPRLQMAQAWATNVSAASPSGMPTTLRGGAAGNCLGVGADGEGTTNVWARWLADGDVALLLFNVGAAAAAVACDASCLAQLGGGPAARWSAQDVWLNAPAGVVVGAQGFVTPTALPPSGGSLLLRLTPLP